MVITDKLSTFSNLREQYGNSAVLKDEHIDENENDAGDKKPEAFLAGFFSKVDIIKKGLDSCQQNIDDIEKVRFESMLSVGVAQEKELSEKLNKLEVTINAYFSSIKKNIDKLVEENKETHPEREATIRSNMMQALLRRFGAAVKLHTNNTFKYKEKIMEKEKRQLALALPDKSPEELDQMIEEGQNTAQIVRDKMGGTHASVLDTLNRVQDKHRDVLKLEKSMNELNEMFRDMAMLVDHQGELLDNIQTSVKNTNVAIVEGEKQVEQAHKWQKRKGKLCAIITCCMTVTIIIILVIMFVMNKVNR